MERSNIMNKMQLNCEFGMCIKDVFNQGSTHAAYSDTDSMKDEIVSVDTNSLYSALEYMSKEELEKLWPEED
jgi:hypothetical protein